MEKHSKWILKIDGEKNIIADYNTKEECIDKALNLIAQQFKNVETIINDVLKRRHTKKCKNLIESFREISKLRTVDVYDPFLDYKGDEVTEIHEDSFKAEWLSDKLFSFGFGSNLKEFYIESNIWIEDEEAVYDEEYFLFVRTKTERIRYSIYKVSSLPYYANIFLVYKALGSTPKTRKEIQRDILLEHGRYKSGYESSGYDISITEDTISNQIYALKRLGIPIYKRTLSPPEKDRKKNPGDVFQEEFDEGFYIDESRPITSDYTKCKNNEKIMFVYLTLKEIDKNHALPTQQAVIDAVRDKFGVTLQRQKVKNYIDVLYKLEKRIRNDKDGYWM